MLDSMPANLSSFNVVESHTLYMTQVNLNVGCLSAYPEAQKVNGQLGACAE